MNLSLSDRNPAGIVGSIHDAATGGNAVTQVVIPAGRSEHSDRPRYVERPTAAGSYTVTAALPGITSAVSAIQTVAAPALRIVSRAGRNPALLGKGLKNYTEELYVERTVNGVRMNGAEALTVTIACASTAVCLGGEVTIPAGQGYAYFRLTGVEVGNTELKATASGYGDATGFKVNVVNPELEFVNLDGSRSLASARDDFYLRFKVPGAGYAYNQTAAADAVIDLSLSDRNPAGIVGSVHDAATGGNVVTQVVIPAGRSDNADRPRYIERPTVAGSYTVTAVLPGVTSAVSGIQNVAAPALRIAATEGRSVIKVGKGLKSPSFEFYVERTVNGVRFNGEEALAVSLTCASTAICLGETVTIPAGQGYARFQLTGVEIGNTEVKASASGYDDAQSFAVDVLPTELEFIGLDGSRSLSGMRDDFYLRFKVPGAIYPYSHTAAADTVINLSLSDQNPAGIVGGVYDAATGGNAVTQVVIAAGQNGSSNRMNYIERPTAAGSYTVTAALPGITSAVSAIQTVTAPALRIASASGNSATVLGKGLKNYPYELYVERVVNGARFNGAEDVTVNLACASTAVCTVPATLTIPAGQGYAYFQATGIDLGNTAITASAAGYGDAQGFGVSVLTPVFQFNGLPGTLAVGATASINVSITVPGAYGWQPAASTTAVTLSNAVPTVAAVPMSTSVAAGSAWSPNFPIKGLSPGDTTITASAPGVTPQTSGTVRVQP